MNPKQLTSDEWRYLEKMIQHIFGMKEPKHLTAKVVRLSPSGKWLAYCLVCIDRRIEDGIVPVRKRMGYLEWMITNMPCSMGDDVICWDDNKTIEEWFMMVMGKSAKIPAWTGMTVLADCIGKVVPRQGFRMEEISQEEWEEIKRRRSEN